MDFTKHFKCNECIYQNPLASKADVQDFVLEGQATISFPNGRLRLENALDPSLEQKANFLFWCPQDFPDRVAFSWDFYALNDCGLAMFFFASKSIEGGSIFDPSLKKREGEYRQYFDSDINALHASYYRRRYGTEREFRLCNLRKSKGLHMVCQGGDPLPEVNDANPPYRITVIKYENEVLFAIRDLIVYHWKDDGKTYGPILTGGKIGFRQMAPLCAEYADFKVHTVVKAND